MSIIQLLIDRLKQSIPHNQLDATVDVSITIAYRENCAHAFSSYSTKIAYNSTRQPSSPQSCLCTSPKKTPNKNHQVRESFGKCCTQDQTPSFPNTRSNRGSPHKATSPIKRRRLLIEKSPPTSCCWPCALSISPLDHDDKRHHSQIIHSVLFNNKRQP